MPSRPPSFDGAGLVNLVSELERRLVGTAPMPGLDHPSTVPEAAGYLLVMFDGLGHHQLSAPEAHDLAVAEQTVLTAGFPTTTTTSLATLATGLAPAGHGIVGHILHLPGVADLVNVLKWVTPSGAPVAHDYQSMLPGPNLWERLSASGIEPITIQPGPFAGSPLSRMLYRGCRFEPVWGLHELVDATVDLARPGRLVVPYFAAVDVTAHLHGQGSDEYRAALSQAASIWTALAARVRRDVTMLGTADHGHIDYRDHTKVLIRHPRFEELRLFGDPRTLFVSGPTDLIEDLAETTRAAQVTPDDLMTLLGPEPHHPQLVGRIPDRALLAAHGTLLMARAFDKRLVGYHGGMEPAEMEIPLLVRREGG